jgi:hypothetical protein
MKRRAVVLIAVLAAVLGVCIAVVGNGAAQQPGPPTGTLELVQRDRETTFRYVDNPPRGGDPERPSPGDLAIIGGTLRDGSNRRVGRVHAIFLRLRGGKMVVDHVSATFVVNGDHIVVDGVPDEAGRRTDDEPITGGTGSYAAARGTLRVTERRRETRYQFSFIG